VIPYFPGDDAVHFRFLGELITLNDPDGRVHRLVQLLDGSRTEAAVASALHADYPDVTVEDVRQAVRDLDGLRLLQDADARPDGLDEEELERWDRNLGFFETYATLGTSKYEFQQRLGAVKVAMLGVGGVGCHIVADIVALGITDLRLVDFDTVQLSNLNRQVLYGEQFLGMSKVEIAAQRVQELNGRAKVEAVNTRLAAAEDVFRVVQDRDIVIAAVDRPKTMILHWLNEGCLRAGAVLMTGGVDTQRAVHYTIVPGLTGCIECWYAGVEASDPASRRVFRALRDQEAEGRYFGEDRAAFNGLVVLQAAFLVAELVRIATRVTAPLSVGRALEATFDDPRLRRVESWKRLDDCVTCGSARCPERFSWLADHVAPAS
jgi:molybdopterin/thiamine biosynthesis adenylyltransferase